MTTYNKSNTVNNENATASRSAEQPLALTFTTDDGLTLAADAWGNPDHPPVLLSHGGGQTRHTWQRTAERLASLGWYAVAYDHRGHGESGWSPDGVYKLTVFAKDLQRIARSFSRAPVLVGASLGGLSALCATSQFTPCPFAAIVLVDITPQMDQRGAQRIMAFMGDNMQRGFGSLDEAATAIAEYTGREKRSNTEGLKKNLRLSDDGRYRWHWDPDFMVMRNQDEPSVSTESLMSAAEQAPVPILLVRGMLSDIVTPEVAEAFLARVPQAHYVDVKDAAHMVVGDKNDAFTESIVDFLTTIG